MALNTRIRGAQINLSAEVIDVSADGIAFVDADGVVKQESVADLATAMAGDGLSASAGVFAVDLNELTEAVIDVAEDYIAFIDMDTGDLGSKKESVADFVSGITGNGLTASNGVQAVQAEDGSISVGASGIKVGANSLDNGHLNAGAGTAGQVLTKGTGDTLSWTNKSSVAEDYLQESEILVEDESANCDGNETDFALASEPVTNSVQVFLNGLLQQEGSGKDYTLGGTGNKTVTFVTAPESGDILLIHYIAT